MCSVINSKLLQGITAVLLDIEGTTTPISFVKETLFGYVRSNVDSYIRQNFESEDVQSDIKALRNQVSADLSACVESVDVIPDSDSDSDVIISAVVTNVLHQMDKDRKTTTLKQLQGHIWRHAYQSGQIRGRLFDDVCPAIQKLTAAGFKVCIYSSGSVEAQKLLFGHSSSGDLLEYLSGFFDTNTGMKIEQDSYSKIAASLQLSPSEILFLTDIVAEASAAREAGMSVCLLSRPGNADLSDAAKKDFRVLTTFDQLFI